MRKRCGFLIAAALSISGAGCGVADLVLSEVLAEMVSDAVAEALLTESATPEEVAGDETETEVTVIVDDGVDAVADGVAIDVVGTQEIPRDAVTVTLINDSTEFAVRVTVAFDDDVVFLAIFGRGDERTFLIEPGESVSFWEKCDDIRIVSVDDADLLIPDRANEGTDSPLLNEGLDYECGDEIRFRFDHSARIDDFDVSVRILTDGEEPRPSLQDSILDFFGG